MKNTIDQKAREGYTLELGKLIDESFATFKKTILISGLGMLIVSVIMVLFYVGLLGSFFGFSNLSKTVLSIETLAKEPNFIIGSGIVSMFVSALFAPFTAGFIHLNYLAHHNKPFGIENLFDFYKEPYYKQIFLSYIVIGGLTALITTVLSLLGYEKLNTFVQILFSLATIFTLPLIIYGKLNYLEALSKSVQLYTKQPLIILVALLIAVIGMLLGIFILCIGIIFTIPYLYAMHYALYAQAVGFDTTSPSIATLEE
jgi:hypothetical protein